MQPTMKLRYVQRGWRNEGPFMVGGATNRAPVYKLQQWWEQPPLTQLGIPQPTGEWRDVPIEVESLP